MSHTVTALREAGGQIDHVEATDAEGRFQRLRADAYVLAMGSLSPLLAAPLGIRLPIYPAKGYSVTMPVKDASMAHQVSLTDDEYKLVFSRLGDRLRIAGTAELNGYDRDLNRVRCEAIVRRTEAALPRRRRRRAGAVLDRAAAGHAVERADHRPLEAGQPVPEHRPRHAGLDPLLRLGQEHRAHRQRAGAGGGLRVRRRADSSDQCAQRRDACIVDIRQSVARLRSPKGTFELRAATGLPSSLHASSSQPCAMRSQERLARACRPTARTCVATLREAAFGQRRLPPGPPVRSHARKPTVTAWARPPIDDHHHGKGRRTLKNARLSERDEFFNGIGWIRTVKLDDWATSFLVPQPVVQLPGSQATA